MEKHDDVLDPITLIMYILAFMLLFSLFWGGIIYNGTEYSLNCVGPCKLRVVEEQQQITGE